MSQAIKDSEARRSVRRKWARLATLAAAFLVVLLYAFVSGGYFLGARSFGEVIILWLIILGLVYELEVPGRMIRLGKLELGLFAGYTFWILMSVMWSIVPARSFEEFVRAVLYLSGFVLVYLFLERREWLAWMGHLFFGIASLVAIDSMLGKVLPDLINHPDLFQANRLYYPVGYWNTLALLMAMGIIIGLRVLSDRETSLTLRTVYAPVMLLFFTVLWFTYSRGGILLLALGICLYLCLARTRLRAILQLVLLSVWTATIIFVSYIFLPNMIQSVPDENLKISEGHKLGIVVLLMMAIALLSQFVIKKLEDRFTVGAYQARRIGYVLATSAVIFVTAVVILFTFSGGRGGPVNFVKSQLNDVVVTNKATGPAADRLLTIKSERFIEYKTSILLFEESPLTGFGAGTWRMAWLKYRQSELTVNNGHSWIFEALAELGLIGSLLLLAFVFTFFAVSIKQFRSLAGKKDKELYGAFFVVCTLFLIHAMIDWDWQMPVVTLTFFMFAGGLLRFGQLSPADSAVPAMVAPGNKNRDGDGWRRYFRWQYLAITGFIAGLIVTILPLISAAKLQTARSVAAMPKPDYILLEQVASDAEAWNPLEAAPLVLKSRAKAGQGDYAAAEMLMFAAIDIEPQNDSIFRELTELYLQEYEAARINGDVQGQKYYAAKAADAFTRSKIINPAEIEETGALDKKMKNIGLPVTTS